VGGADQAPFAVDCSETAPHEPSVAAIRLDVAEDGFDRTLSFVVEDLVGGILWVPKIPSGAVDLDLSVELKVRSGSAVALAPLAIGGVFRPSAE